MTQFTFSEVAILWKADKKKYVKRSSYAAYVLHLNKHLLPYFGSKKDIGAEDIQQYADDRLSGGLGLKTLNYYIATREIAPSTGHVHIHIYCQFTNSVRLSLKKLMGAHLDKCYGSPQQNLDYIYKVKEPEKEVIIEEKIEEVPTFENEFVEEVPRRGRRNRYFE